MKSFTPDAVLQLPPHVNAVVVVTSATLPEVADMFVVPVASGVGSAAPWLPPEPSLTRYLEPGWIVPDSAVTR